MKKRRRLLLMIAAGVLIVVAGAVIFAFRYAGDLAMVQERDAAIFGDNTLSSVAQEWSPEVLKFYGSTELISDRNDEDRQTKMAKLRNDLGAYVSGDGVVRNLRVAKDLGGDDALVGDYSVRAHFAKGDAVVEMKLMKRKVGDWQVMTFKVFQE